MGIDYNILKNRSSSTKYLNIGVCHYEGIKLLSPLKYIMKKNFTKAYELKVIIKNLKMV